MQYFFILGNNPTLSIAEILSQLDKSFKTETLTDNFLILQSEESLNANVWQKKLGGTIKIGTVLDQAKNFRSETAVEILKSFRRPHFGFSFYGNNDDFIGQSKRWAMEIKNQLKQKNIPSRWVVAKEKTLSSVVVLKNKLLAEGAEFVFLASNDKNYFGQTISCQEFEDYGHRDFDRPARNIEEGMLPPKLAKMMINLAKVSQEKTILDPFCGSGTILQEALLMGCQNVIGADLSEEAIKNSQENISWLIKNYQLSVTNYQLFQHDVRNISQKIPPNSVNAIVTEPYLGPIKNLNLKFEISNIITVLSDLYLKAFSEFKKIMESRGKIVIIFPAFRIGNELKFLPILEEIKKMGWQIVNPLSSELKNSPVLKVTTRNSIVYSRPDQTVLREIFIFEPTNY
jgi:tRNA G10  N-methylase Trm11